MSLHNKSFNLQGEGHNCSLSAQVGMHCMWGRLEKNERSSFTGEEPKCILGQAVPRQTPDESHRPKSQCPSEVQSPQPTLLPPAHTTTTTLSKVIVKCNWESHKGWFLWRTAQCEDPELNRETKSRCHQRNLQLLNP